MELTQRMTTLTLSSLRVARRISDLPAAPSFRNHEFKKTDACGSIPRPETS
jgi:hypothetical protein